MMNYTKYRPYPTMDMPNRKWPGNTITKAPVWCSVDMRDGNQSLEIPMNLPEKLKFFQFLVDTGFKEIEIGFPAASDTEFEFARCLIDNNLIPDDVTVQVLTQSRPHIIHKTFEPPAPTCSCGHWCSLRRMRWPTGSTSRPCPRQSSTT